METSEALSIESFSYSWLSNIKRPSIDDSLDDPLRPSLRKTPATNPAEKSQDNFDFHTANISHSHASFVHADEIFSNGIIRSVSVDNPTLPTVKTGLGKPSNSVVRRATFPHPRCRLLWKWRKSSERIIQKWFSYIKMPSCYNTEGCRRKTSSRFQEVQSWNSSPRQSVARTSHSTGHWSDDESSIFDAVLHCKRSIGRRFYET